MKRKIGILGVALFVVVATACGGDDDTSSATTGGSAQATTSTTTVASEPAAVRVYFAWHEKVGTAGRSVDASSKEEHAVDALLEGPDGFEQSIGMTTAIPSGTKLLGLEVASGIATVDLSSQFQSGGGSLSMQLRTAELVFTLTQFNEVQAVTITLDGESVEAIGGEGIPAADLDRTDFENVTPLILVEAPVPGQTVASPLEVSGIANTFEANVNYSVNDPEGLVLDDGFTTASAGNGAWGEFAFSVSYTTSRTGLGSVILWETSAQDGSQQNVYEVPVRMG